MYRNVDPFHLPSLNHVHIDLDLDKMSRGMWTKGLFGCFSDISTCVITFLAPYYTAGKNAEAAGESCLTHGIYTLIPIVCCYCASTIRGKIREQKSIDGTFINDLLLCLFCPYCALIQVAQEIKEPAPLAMARE